MNEPLAKLIQDGKWWPANIQSRRYKGIHIYYRVFYTRKPPKMTEPTISGIRRYPPHGYRHVDNNPANDVACTCNSDCPSIEVKDGAILGECTGACGCKACHDAYQDFMSGQGYW